MSWSKSKTKSEPVEETELSHKDSSQKDVTTATDAEEKEYPSTKVVITTVLSVCLVIFLSALDRTIVGVAVPVISNEFHSFDQIAWYESAFLLTNCAFLLPMGKVYTYYPTKWVFIAAVIVFEIGSIISAAAPTSPAFIIGRAISGIGCAGSQTGGNLIFVDILPLEKRAKYLGFLGATFGLASIAGPLLGGVFTTKVTWRWCFWINVPIGGLAIVVLLFILKAKAPPRKQGASLMERIWEFDPIGTALVLPGLIMVILALQWGGNQYAWSSARIVALLVVGLLLLVAFGVSQWRAGDNGMVPPRIAKQRSILVATVVSFTFGSVLIILTFYLPIWYQGIKGQTAVGAGIKLLPYFLSTVVFVITSGLLVNTIGYYTPVLIGGSAILIVGCALLTTFNINTSAPRAIGYQVIIGAGMGLTLAQANNAVQTVLSREDIALGITLITFTQFLGGAVFVSVCQALLSNRFRKDLSKGLPSFDVSQLSNSGATDLAKLVPTSELPVLLAAYNDGLIQVFYLALGMACGTFLASFFLEWKTMKKQPKGAAAEAEAEAQTVATETSL